MRMARAGLLVQALFYVVAGVNHFWHRQFYVRIMPDHYSRPDILVIASGVAEIFGGIGLSYPIQPAVVGLVPDAAAHYFLRCIRIHDPSC
jgi:uncharacterized membrane protein